MTKQMEIIFGLIILLAVIFGFGGGLLWTRPSAKEVQDKRTVKVTPVPQNVLQLDVAKRIKALSVNGRVPVTVSPIETGRSNPFSPF